MAATTGAIEAGSAFVRLFADDGPLRGGLNAASQYLQSWGSALQSVGQDLMLLGVGMVTPLVVAAMVYADAGSALVDMSGRTGIAVEQLGALQYAAEQSGASVEDLEGGVRNLQKNLVKAKQGSKEVTQTLSKLGLSAEQLLALTPDQQLDRIADALAGVEDPAQRTALAMELLGKSGSKLVPFLSQGSAAIGQLKNEARALGLVMSKEDAVAAKKFGGVIATLGKLLKRTSEIVGAAVTPALSAFGEIVRGILVGVNKWIDANRGLFNLLLAIGAGITVAGAAIFALGSTLALLGFIIGGISTALGVIVPAVTAIGTVLGAAFAFLASWPGIIAAAVVALGAVILYQTGAASAAVKGLADWWGSLYSTATKAWGGIVDALAAGDLALAGQIAFLGLQVEWQRVVNAIGTAWETFAAWFTQEANDAFYGAAQIANNSGSWLQSAWADASAGIGNTWDTMLNGLEHGWRNTSNFLAEGILWVMSLFDRNLSQNFDKRVAEMRAERDRVLQQSDDSTSSNAAGRETGRAARQKEIESARAAEQDRLAKLNADANAKARESRNKAIADAEKVMTFKQNDLDRAVADAKKKREEFAANLSTGEAGKTTDPTAGVNEAAKSSVTGTFNSAAVRAILGGGGESAQERTAKATEQTAKNTANMRGGAALEAAFSE